MSITTVARQTRLGNAEPVHAAKVPLTYAVVMIAATPVVRWWGRLQVTGHELLAASGPTILMANHDSAWDPVVIGVAARGRQIRALAKSSLWKARPMAWVLDHMGQIPIERGRGDLAALSAAIDHLRQAQCIGIFPEGTVSRGRRMRFPRRPAIRVEFFEPASGQPVPEDSAITLTRRIMAEVRAQAPAAIPGRAKKRAHYERLLEDGAVTDQPTQHS